MSLTHKQLTFIRAVIEEEQIKIPTLRDDLLDHVCCVTEEKMANGDSFETALKDSLKELAPNGLIKIEQETLFLLNFNKILFMKKLTFFAGVICSTALATGLVLGLMNFPIGHMMFGLAAFAFLLVYVPADAIRHFRLTKDPIPEKLRYVMSSTASIVLATGVMAWIMRLPGAREILITGLIIFLAGFLPLQMLRLYKTTFHDKFV